jgi:hypothetical protein
MFLQEWPGMGVPSTIPAGNETDQFFVRKLAPTDFTPAPVTLTVSVRYADVFERRTYGTTIRILAHFEDAPPAFPPQTVNVLAEFLDSDERSAQERRIL